MVTHHRGFQAAYIYLMSSREEDLCPGGTSANSPPIYRWDNNDPSVPFPLRLRRPEGGGVGGGDT